MIVFILQYSNNIYFFKNFKELLSFITPNADKQMKISQSFYVNKKLVNDHYLYITKYFNIKQFNTQIVSFMEEKFNCKINDFLSTSHKNFMIEVGRRTKNFTLNLTTGDKFDISTVITREINFTKTIITFENSASYLQLIFYDNIILL